MVDVAECGKSPLDFLWRSEGFGVHVLGGGGRGRGRDSGGVRRTERNKKYDKRYHSYNNSKLFERK